MARDTELAKLKAEIEAIEKKGTATRYPDPLRRRAVEFVASQRARGIPIARTCKALGLTLQSLDYWRRTVPGTAIVPVGFQKVEIITEPERPTLVVHGPRGLRVEGVSVTQLAELIRSLA